MQFPIQIETSRIISHFEELKNDLYEKEKSIKSISLKALLNLQESLVPIVPLHQVPPKLSPELIIRYITTQIYKEKIDQLTLFEVPFPLALKAEFIRYAAFSHVVLTTLFSKNILIRSPLPSESEKIFSKYEDEGLLK